MGEFCPMAELHQEGSAPEACAAGLFLDLLSLNFLLFVEILMLDLLYFLVILSQDFICVSDELSWVLLYFFVLLNPDSLSHMY